MAIKSRAADLYAAAEEQSRIAAQHRAQATRHLDAGNAEKAAQHARRAREHTILAADHADYASAFHIL